MANATTIREKGSDGIEFTAAIPASQPGDVFPAGVMLHYAGSAAPSGWLLCDGTVVSRATYPNLFSAIGTTFGAGDGSTTFGLPDTRGKVPVSKHSSGTFTTLGATGGEETHVLSQGELAAHIHGISAESPGTGTESADHTHATSVFGFVSAGAGTTTGKLYGSAGVDVLTNTFGFTSGGRSAAHTHTVNSHAHGGATANVGSNTAHNNLQPYIVLNHIIRAY